MEIATAPRATASTPWRRWVATAIVLAPVTLFVLLPMGLGLQRYVITTDAMAPNLGRGTVAFERVVPVSDLRVGDVISFPRPITGDLDDVVTRRIVSVDPHGIVTRGDGRVHTDPWVLRPAGGTVSRVAFSVPYVGWAYLAVVGPSTWLLVAAAALAIVVLLRRRRVTAVVVPEPREGTLTSAGTGRSDMRSRVPTEGANEVNGE